MTDTPAEEKKTTRMGRGRRAPDGGAAGNKTEDGDRPKTTGNRGRGRGRGARDDVDKDKIEAARAGDKNNTDAAYKPEGRGRGERRAQTARQQANDAEGTEETKGGDRGNRRGGRGRGDRGGDRGGDREDRGGAGRGQRREEKAQDKNSWIYKYHNMDRPQYEKKAFTSASVIPDLPAKKDLLKEPVKAEFDREMAVQDEVI